MSTGRPPRRPYVISNTAEVEDDHDRDYDQDIVHLGDLCSSDDTGNAVSPGCVRDEPYDESTATVVRWPCRHYSPGRGTPHSPLQFYRRQEPLSGGHAFWR